jgi:hypothetical protein
MIRLIKNKILIIKVDGHLNLRGNKKFRANRSRTTKTFKGENTYKYKKLMSHHTGIYVYTYF